MGPRTEGCVRRRTAGLQRRSGSTEYRIKSDRSEDLFLSHAFFARSPPRLSGDRGHHILDHAGGGSQRTQRLRIRCPAAASTKTIPPRSALCRTGPERNTTFPTCRARLAAYRSGADRAVWRMSSYTSRDNRKSQGVSDRAPFHSAFGTRHELHRARHPTTASCKRARFRSMHRRLRSGCLAQRRSTDTFLPSGRYSSRRN